MFAKSDGLLCFVLLDEAEHGIEEKDRKDDECIRETVHGRAAFLKERQEEGRGKSPDEDVDEDIVELPQEGRTRERFFSGSSLKPYCNRRLEISASDNPSLLLPSSRRTSAED